MKLPWYILPNPFRIGRVAGNTLYPFIFIRKDIYNDLKSSKPLPMHIAVLEHELLHRKRQKEQGLIIFGLKYIFSPKYRVHEELIAYKKQQQVVRSYKEDFKNEVIAGHLSSWMYFGAISYKDAMKMLRKKF